MNTGPESPAEAKGTMGRDEKEEGEKSKSRSSSRCQLLPQDLIREILLKLPANSVARFRCVSRTWLSISSDPSFLLSHSSLSPKSLLIQTITSESEAYCVYFNNPELFTPLAGFGLGCKSSTQKTLTLPLSLREPTVETLASCDGLLFVRKCGPQYYVLNPLTSRLIALPEPCFDSQVHINGFGFYYHRWTGEYRLVNVSGNLKPCLYRTEVLSVGAEAWRPIEASSPMISVMLWHSPVFMDDCLHWIGYESRKVETSVVLLFDIRSELFRLMPSPPFWEQGGLILQENILHVSMGLVDVGGKLGYWVAGKDESSTKDLKIEVWVLEGGEIKKWIKAYSVSCSREYKLLKGEGFCSQNYNTALCIKDGELLFLFDGVCGIFYLVRCNLNSGKYCVDKVLVERSITFPILRHAESLVSYDSSCIFYCRTLTNHIGKKNLIEEDMVDESEEIGDPVYYDDEVDDVVHKDRYETLVVRKKLTESQGRFRR